MLEELRLQLETHGITGTNLWEDGRRLTMLVGQVWKLSTNHGWRISLRADTTSPNGTTLVSPSPSSSRAVEGRECVVVRPGVDLCHRLFQAMESGTAADDSTSPYYTTNWYYLYI